MIAIPYWRLSLFYLFYFSSLGALLPYFPLYLQHLNFDAQTIGEFIAIISLTRIIAPNIWGWLADHTGKHIFFVRLGAVGALIGFCGIFLGNSYGWIMLVLVTFSFFWNAALPQMEAMTFIYLETQPERYNHIRLWGSIGFIIAVMALGWLLENYSVELLPITVAVLFVGILISSFLIVEPKNKIVQEIDVSLGSVLKRPEVIALLLVCFLNQASHTTYYIFYVIHLKEYGYTLNVTGQLIALGVIAEVIVFLVMHRLLAHFSLRNLLITSFVLTGLRWLMIGFFYQWFIILLLAQLLHAVSFGLYHSVAIRFIHQYFTGKLRGRGQALYNSVSFGAGAAMGSLISGYTWESMGAEFSYFLAFLECLVATWISWQWVSNPYNNSH